MATCQITFLCKRGTILVEGLTSVDEIDTILINQEQDHRQVHQHTRDKSQFDSKITNKWTEINKEKKFLTL